MDKINILINYYMIWLDYYFLNIFLLIHSISNNLFYLYPFRVNKDILILNSDDNENYQIFYIFCQLFIFLYQNCIQMILNMIILNYDFALITRTNSIYIHHSIIFSIFYHYSIHLHKSKRLILNCRMCLGLNHLLMNHDK